MRWRPATCPSRTSSRVPGPDRSSRRNPMAVFRILSLDGGGIMGAFTASVLATFEEATGKKIVDHFDLITGTSTGGLIAIALGLGASAEKVCNFYTERGPAI